VNDAVGGPAGPPAAVPANTVVRVLAVLPQASTSPALVETGDGARWVLKFSGAGHGPFGLLTELLAIGIARGFGAPVPAARPLLLPSGFPWMAGTDEFDAMLQRSYGWNLGIAFVPDAHPASLADLAPAPELDAIARADCFLQNVDRTAKNPNLLMADGRLWAIDYDACLYLSRALGPARPPSTALPPGHLLADRPLRPAPAPEIDLSAALAATPDAWVETTGRALTEIADRLVASLAAWEAAQRGDA
jgi:hypothetical protein